MEGNEFVSDLLKLAEDALEIIKKAEEKGDKYALEYGAMLCASLEMFFNLEARGVVNLSGLMEDGGKSLTARRGEITKMYDDLNREGLNRLMKHQEVVKRLESGFREYAEMYRGFSESSA